MAKTEKPKRSPRTKTKPKTTDPEQSERFIEAARELGVEEAGKAFEDAFNKVARKKNDRIGR